MEGKTYGIKTHLVEEFKQLQISRQKIAMAFLGNCTLVINATPIRTRIDAANGIISLLPFPLFPAGLVGFRIPPQRLNLIFPNVLSIMFHPALRIDLLFDTDEQKRVFIGALNLQVKKNGR
jgi:hypothetical protein